MSETKILDATYEKMNILCNKYADGSYHVRQLFYHSQRIFRYLIDLLKLNAGYHGMIEMSREDADPIKCVLQEFFPSSEINFKNNRDGVGNSNNGTMTINISLSNEPLARNIINEHKNYLENKKKKLPRLIKK